MEALSLAAEVWGLCTPNLSPADCPHCGLELGSSFPHSLRTARTLLWSQPLQKLHKVCSAGMELEDGESPSLGAVSIFSTLFQSSVSGATWQMLARTKWQSSEALNVYLTVESLTKSRLTHPFCNQQGMKCATLMIEKSLYSLFPYLVTSCS